MTIDHSIITHDNIMIDMNEYQLFVSGKEIPVRIKELRLIHLFVSNPGRTITRAEIARVCWPGKDVTDICINTTMCNLRKKTGIDIKSRPQIGYRYA